MHEASLMQNLITIAEKTVREHNVKLVNSITLSVGKLSNAMPDALSFAFDAMTQSGPLKGAQLIIKEEPVKVRCENCGAQYEPERFPFICPVCKGVYYTIIQGEDIYIQSLECEEA